MRRTAVLAVVAIVLIACGGDDDPTTTTESTATTESTTTTTAATTTTLSAEEEDEAAVRDLAAAHDSFFLEAGNPPNPDDPRLSEIYTNPQRQRRIDQLQNDKARGWATMGTFESEILSIEGLGTDEVVALICFQDNSWVEDTSGQRVFEASGDTKTSELHMHRTADGWRIAEEIPVDDPCQLEDR